MAHMWQHMWPAVAAACSTLCASLVWTSHVTRVNASWHICNLCQSGAWHVYKWVMAHIWVWCITRMSKSWHTREWAGARTRFRQVRHACERVMRQHKEFERAAFPFTRANESWHTYEWVMAHTWISHVKDEEIWKHVRVWMEIVYFYSQNKKCKISIRTRIEIQNFYSHTHVLSHSLNRNTKFLNRNTKFLFTQYFCSHTWMSHGTHINESWDK